MRTHSVVQDIIRFTSIAFASDLASSFSQMSQNHSH